MTLRRLASVRRLQISLYRATEIRSNSSSLLSSSSKSSPEVFYETEFSGKSSYLCMPWDSNSRNIACYSSRSIISSLNNTSSLPWSSNANALRSTTGPKLPKFGYLRSVTMQAKASPQARQMAAVKVSLLSPGVVFEPYAPREAMPFWKRWFTRTGWRRIKEELTSELKSAYAIAKLRKTGYSKQKFYDEALDLYKEINTYIANGDKTSLRKSVTEKMYSALKNEIRQRESVWSHVYWELIEPIVRIRTLRARMILLLTSLLCSERRFATAVGSPTLEPHLCMLLCVCLRHAYSLSLAHIPFFDEEPDHANSTKLLISH